MSLDELRREIDEVDAELVRLLDRRARLGRGAAEIKKAAGLPLYAPEREEKVLERLAALSDGGMACRGLKNIYRMIMAETLALEGVDPAGQCRGDATRGKAEWRATVLENVAVAPGFCRMRLKSPPLSSAFEPGQFFQLRVAAGRHGPLLRRPFAPSEATPDGIAFVYRVVGEGTRMLSGLQPGAAVSLLAPLGKGYSRLEAGGSALLVGGGCGAPSLRPLAKRLREGGTNVTFALGARTASGLLEKDAFAAAADSLIVATDDGSVGYKGTILDAVADRRAAGALPFDRVYACGPDPMLRAVAALAEKEGLYCEVSLEERMACGFGACMGCAVAVNKGNGATGYVRVCHEGPVFDARDIAWDLLEG